MWSMLFLCLMHTIVNSSWFSNNAKGPPPPENFHRHTPPPHIYIYIYTISYHCNVTKDHWILTEYRSAFTLSNVTVTAWRSLNSNINHKAELLEEAVASLWVFGCYCPYQREAICRHAILYCATQRFWFLILENKCMVASLKLSLLLSLFFFFLVCLF